MRYQIKNKIQKSGNLKTARDILGSLTGLERIAECFFFTSSTFDAIKSTLPRISSTLTINKFDSDRKQTKQQGINYLRNFFFTKQTGNFQFISYKKHFERNKWGTNHTIFFYTDHNKSKLF